MRRIWPAFFFFVAMLAYVACIPAPTGPIMGFNADHDRVTNGKTAMLTANFDVNGTTATIDNGVGDVASGVPIETPKITGPITFTLTVVDMNGQVWTSSVSLDAVEAPVIKSFKADKVVRPGQATTVTAVFSGGPGIVDMGIGTITSGTPFNTGVLAVTKIYTLTVMNEAGDKAVMMAEAEAAVTPVITSFSAPSPIVSRFAPTMLTAVYTGGHGKVDQGVGDIPSNKPTPSSKVPAAGATFTLTVTNGLGEAVTKSLSVTTKKELFVSDYGGDVLVYDADSVGDVPPKRTILTGEGKNANQQIAGILGVVATDTEVFVANEQGVPAITIFGIADDGDVPPLRKISGSNTTIFGAYMISVSNGEIFVADKTSVVKVWNVSDNGNVAPKRTIEGAATMLDNSLATFVDNGELYVTNFASAGVGAGSVTVYPQTAGGNAAPTRRIPTDGATGLLVSGNEVFVNAKIGEITVYDKTTGVQLRKIAGPNTQLTELYQCSIGDSELYCASYVNDRVVVYPTNANGDVKPSRVIMGDKTYIASPACAFVF